MSGVFYCADVGPNRTEESCRIRLEKGWCTTCRKFGAANKQEETEPMWKCLNCGKDNGSRAKSCTTCGTKWVAKTKIKIKPKDGEGVKPEGTTPPPPADTEAEITTEQKFTKLVATFEANNPHILTVDLSKYPDIHSFLCEMAELDFRTPEMEMLAILNKEYTEHGQKTEAQA